MRFQQDKHLGSLSAHFLIRILNISILSLFWRSGTNWSCCWNPLWRRPLFHEALDAKEKIEEEPLNEISQKSKGSHELPRVYIYIIYIMYLCICVCIYIHSVEVMWWKSLKILERMGRCWMHHRLRSWGWKISLLWIHSQWVCLPTLCTSKKAGCGIS